MTDRLILGSTMRGTAAPPSGYSNSDDEVLYVVDAEGVKSVSSSGAETRVAGENGVNVADSSISLTDDNTIKVSTVWLDEQFRWSFNKGTSLIVPHAFDPVVIDLQNYTHFDISIVTPDPITIVLNQDLPFPTPYEFKIRITSPISPSIGGWPSQFRWIGGVPPSAPSSGQCVVISCTSFSNSSGVFYCRAETFSV